MRLAARILYSLWASRITGEARHRRARRSGAGIVGPRERRRGGSAGAKPPGSGSLFPPDILRVLVVAQAGKRGVTEAAVTRPLDERNLRDEVRCDPSQLRHLVGSNALAPVTGLRLRQIDERTGPGGERLQPLEDGGAQVRRKSVANLPGAEQAPAFAVSHQQ